MIKNESVILIPVPEAEEIISGLRAIYDPVGLKGIPAHITLLFPFKFLENIKPEDIDKLKKIFNFNKFKYSLSKINTFPDVVFIEPEERELFIEITKKIYKEFPQFPPFEGKFLPEINPHLTIGHQLGDKFNECLSESKKIENKLPLKCIAREVLLMRSENGWWKTIEKFDLI